MLIWALLLIGFVATAIPFLKARPAEGLIAVAVGIVAWLGGYYLGLAGALLAAAIFCGVAIYVALRPADPDSAWARMGKKDRHGRRIRYEQSTASWLGHSALGTVIGLAPGVTVVALASLLEAVGFLVPGQASPASFGVPMALAGAIAGAFIGANYIPANAEQQESEKLGL